MEQSILIKSNDKMIISRIHQFT